MGTPFGCNFSLIPHYSELIILTELNEKIMIGGRSSDKSKKILNILELRAKEQLGVC